MFLSALASLLAAVSLAAPSAPAGSAPPPRTFVLVPPVEAPITHRFRPPMCLYCSGNRAIDYGPTLDLPIRAAASGVVSYSGPIAGAIWVTIEHRYGYRTSYGPLADRTVAAGETIATGQIIGRGGPSLSFSLRFGPGARPGGRRDEVYVDPEAYFGARGRRVARLVP